MTDDEKQYEINRMITKSEDLHVNENIPNLFCGEHFYLEKNIPAQIVNEISWIIVVSGGYEKECLTF